jgi:hypothetical protein
MVRSDLKFEIITDGVGEFLSLDQAGPVYDNGYAMVEMGKTMEPDGTTRVMTAEERRAIVSVADRYSESK